MNERFEAKEAEDLYILRKMFFLPSLLHIYIYFAQNVHFFFYTRCFSQNFRNFKHDVQFPYLLKTRNEYLCSRYINMWELVWGNFPKNGTWSCVLELRLTKMQLQSRVWAAFYTNAAPPLSERLLCRIFILQWIRKERISLCNVVVYSNDLISHKNSWI